MLFNSHEFLFLYLPIVFFGFFQLARRNRRLAAVWLVAASLFFYGWWNPQFVLLLLGSVAFNFSMGYAIGRKTEGGRPTGNSNVLLAIAITADLFVLGYFKYTNFFIDTLNQATGSDLGLAQIALPLGISFFTFTQIAFLVDVHRGIAREYDFVHYLLFVSYFPHLIAGPVLHHKQMMPQFDEPATYRLDTANVNLGLTIFAIGLFKKVVLADQFALYSNPVFDSAASGLEPKLIEAWIGALAYSLQLYFDFSGYSDMAIGASKMLNIDLPLNFDSPYKAANIIDFWRRWHMTLSAFLRDYLYIPLGGNRHGKARRYVNLLVTMLLGGLWHGANWTFVLWGGLHGLYLVINHGWRAISGRLGAPRIRGGALLAASITYVAVVVAWVPFRADSFASAMRIVAGMAGMNGTTLPVSLQGPLGFLSAYGIGFEGAAPIAGLLIVEVACWLIAGHAIVWLLPNAQKWLRAGPTTTVEQAPGADWMTWRATPLVAIFTGTMLAVSILCVTRASQFLYFQF